MRVLLVEDDPALGRLVVRGLHREHYAVDHLTTYEAALEALTVTDYDVACIDLGLPDGDGLELCRLLHSARHLRRPRRVVIVTARDAVEQRVAGLDAGADDYLVKPFQFAELAARIRAVSRRHDEAVDALVVGDVEIDRATHEVRRRGSEIELTSREFSVLRYLAIHENEFVSAERLLEHCWDSNADELTTSVRVILSRVRKKLGAPDVIDTVRGVGYRFRSAR